MFLSGVVERVVWSLPPKRPTKCLGSKGPNHYSLYNIKEYDRKAFVEAGCSSYEPKWIFVDHEYEEFDALSVARALDGASK